MKRLLQSKTMIEIVIVLLGITSIGAYIQKNDLSGANKTSQFEIINK